jgi:flagellar basal body-associated protein FliL
MIDAESQETDVEGEQAEQPGGSKSLLIRWIAAIVLGSVVVHGALYFMLRKSPQPPAPLEQKVGSFDFVAATGGNDARGETAKFDLHVRFVEDLAKPARERLVEHQYRVREAVENLLRRSRPVDVSDTAMARLKHEIQERVDDSLDLRAVAEVIITNLKIDSTNRPTAAAISDEPVPPAKKVIEPTAALQTAD